MAEIEAKIKEKDISNDMESPDFDDVDEIEGMDDMDEDDNEALDIRLLNLDED